jgi:hypothetical protein
LFRYPSIIKQEKRDFTTDDLELLDLTARLVVVAISNSRCYDEILTTNMARKNLIIKIVDNIGNLPEKKIEMLLD